MEDRGDLTGGKGLSLLVLEKSKDARLELDRCLGRFLPRFDSWLMVGIHVDERGIQTDRSFIEGDEGTDRPSIDLFNCNRHGFSSLLVKGFLGTPEKMD